MVKALVRISVGVTTPNVRNRTLRPVAQIYCRRKCNGNRLLQRSLLFLHSALSGCASLRFRNRNYQRVTDKIRPSLSMLGSERFGPRIVHGFDDHHRFIEHDFVLTF
jgi:hypothetical protein